MDTPPVAPLPTLIPPPEASPQEVELANAYLVVALHASELHRLIRTMAGAAQPHPHGTEPRVVVFKKEFEAVIACGANDYSAPAIAEGERLNAEIQSLLRAQQQAASVKALLRRLASDLSVATIEEMLDLIHTELNTVPPVTAAYPTEAELAAIYYPVEVTAHDQLRAGDVIFNPETKLVVYQHGSVRESPAASDGFAQRMTGNLCLRPIGAQAVLALRWRLTVKRLASLAAAESQMGKPLHTGRAQGMQLAQELLAMPAWSLPPAQVKLTPPV